MGISGLLPLIKPICQQKSVQTLAGSRVGIDVYGWLHKGIFACASKVCRGVDTNIFVEYCMHRVRMLLHFRVTPVLVFDGADLPMKADTHAERKSRRDEARAKADAAYAAGDLRRAEEWYQRACTVTADMARRVIRECRKLNVEYVVAPYEADAQLAWMVANGHIDTVITEDSDLLVYGANKVLYKMTRDGDGDLFERRNLPALDTISLLNFTDDMFMFMCVCSGCDFFKGVPGLGIRKSQPIVKRARTLARVIQAIRGKHRVSPTFTADFARACLVFRHQTVYDLKQKSTVSLRPLDVATQAALPPGVLTKNADGSIDMSFLGRLHYPSVAQKVAQGLIHPRTLEEYPDPLDIVERPVMRRARSNFFPTPSLPPTRTESPKKRRGFAVQPASQAQSSTQATQFTPAPNLRDRLTSSRIGTFNPVQAARTFNMRNSGTRAPNPRAAAPSGIWSKFRPATSVQVRQPSPIAGSTAPAGETGSNIRKQLQVGDAATAEHARADSSESNSHPSNANGEKATGRPVSSTLPESDGTVHEHAQPTLPEELPGVSQLSEEPSHLELSAPDRSTEEVMPANGLVGKKTGRDEDEIYLAAVDEEDNRLQYSNDIPSAKRQKIESNRNKSGGLDRLIQKFKVKPTDPRMKFVPQERPPSPDADAYEAFAEIDADLSRDGEENISKLATPAKSTPQEPPQAATPTSAERKRPGAKSGQLLVSRFFASSQKSPLKPQTNLKVRAPGLKRPRPANSATPKSTPSRGSKSKALKPSTLDRFRRGVAGRKVSAEDVKR